MVGSLANNDVTHFPFQKCLLNLLLVFWPFKYNRGFDLDRDDIDGSAAVPLRFQCGFSAVSVQFQWSFGAVSVPSPCAVNSDDVVTRDT